MDNSENETDSHTIRAYRNIVHSALVPIRVAVQETDLSIYADAEIAERAKEAVITQRGYIERYITIHPNFMHTFSMWPQDAMAPIIVRNMIAASRQAQVGPMAAVAGAIAEQVGKALLDNTSEVIVENGGDIFLCSHRDLTVAIYANQSPLSLKVGVRLPASRMPLAVCTSSGTVGHSHSDGKADAICIVSSSCALADAAATAIGNRIQTADDVPTAIAWGRSIDGIEGGVVIIGEKMGVWGQIELMPVAIKKG